MRFPFRLITQFSRLVRDRNNYSLSTLPKKVMRHFSSLLFMLFQFCFGYFLGGIFKRDIYFFFPKRGIIHSTVTRSKTHSCEMHESLKLGMKTRYVSPFFLFYFNTYFLCLFKPQLELEKTLLSKKKIIINVRIMVFVWFTISEVFITFSSGAIIGWNCNIIIIIIIVVY